LVGHGEELLDVACDLGSVGVVEAVVGLHHLGLRVLDEELLQGGKVAAAEATDRPAVASLVGRLAEDEVDRTTPLHLPPGGHPLE
jgi:hypothetical protein